MIRVYYGNKKGNEEEIAKMYASFMNAIYLVESGDGILLSRLQSKRKGKELETIQSDLEASAGEFRTLAMKLRVLA